MGGENDENSKIWEVGGQPRAAGELGRAPRAPRWQHRRFHLLFLPLFILSIPFFAHFHPLSFFFPLYLFPPLFLPISVLFISFFGTFSYLFPPFPPSQSLFFFAHFHSLSPIFFFARFCPLYHYLCPFSPSVFFSPPFSYPQSLFLHVFFPSHPFRCPFFIPFLFFLLFSLSFFLPVFIPSASLG